MDDVFEYMSRDAQKVNVNVRTTEFQQFTCFFRLLTKHPKGTLKV